MVDGDEKRDPNGGSSGSCPTAVDRRVGRRIKLRRVLLEIELHHLAGDLGILASALARIEAGEERPAPPLLARIASYLGVSVRSFFRDFAIGSARASDDRQQDGKPTGGWASVQRDIGSEMQELLDLFIQADAADRQAIMGYTRDRLAKQEGRQR